MKYQVLQLTTLFILFDMNFTFIIVVIASTSYFLFVFRSWKSTKEPVENTLIALYGNSWMHGTNQFLSLEEVYYRISCLNFSWQILKWKEYASSQLITPVKSNHMFTMAVEKLKAFLMLLLISGYHELPIKEM